MSGYKERLPVWQNECIQDIFQDYSAAIHRGLRFDIDENHVYYGCLEPINGVDFLLIGDGFLTMIPFSMFDKTHLPRFVCINDWGWRRYEFMPRAWESTGGPA